MLNFYRDKWPVFSLQSMNNSSNKIKVFSVSYQSDLIGALKSRQLVTSIKHRATIEITIRACTNIRYLFPFLLGLKHKKRQFRRKTDSTHVAHIMQEVSQAKKSGPLPTSNLN